MKLFVLRHGKAREGSPDALRELKKRGREDVAWVLQSRLNDLQGVKKIQSSALVRAEQTAQIAAEVLGYDGNVEENMHLTPWAKPMDFLKTVDEQAGDFLVASHQPFVSDLVTVLTGEDLWMPTSSLVCVEAELMTPGLGTVLWQQNPKN